MHLNYSTKALFTGSEWLNDVVVHIENELVVGIEQKGFDVNNAIPFIIPALIDLQLYGACGKLLSEFPEKETIEKIKKHSSKSINSNKIEKYYCVLTIN